MPRHKNGDSVCTHILSILRQMNSAFRYGGASRHVVLKATYQSVTKERQLNSPYKNNKDSS